VNLRDVRVEVLELPIQLIDEPELPARAAMDEQKLQELTTDIRAKGVLVPISVVRTGERYEVIAGHRRRIAAGLAGLSWLRCLVYPTKDTALEGLKYSENRFREAMSPAEEAVYFGQLLERDCGGDTNALCGLLGEKRSYVEGRLLLLQGDPEVLNALQRTDITIGVAHELNKCTEELMRRYYLERAVREGSTVAVVTGWVQQWRSSLGPGGVVPASPKPAAGDGPTSTSTFFTCYVCGKTKDTHAMRSIMVHDYCERAVLDPLVHGEGDAATQQGSKAR